MRYADELNTIPVFTVSEFRGDMAKVFNQLLSSGKVIIEHRDRPDMALVSKDLLDEMIEKGRK
jgi:hypothetical protein